MKKLCFWSSNYKHEDTNYEIPKKLVRIPGPLSDTQAESKTEKCDFEAMRTSEVRTVEKLKAVNGPKPNFQVIYYESPSGLVQMSICQTIEEDNALGDNVTKSPSTIFLRRFSECQFHLISFSVMSLGKQARVQKAVFHLPHSLTHFAPTKSNTRCYRRGEGGDWETIR